jgi:hypothetical protein
MSEMLRQNLHGLSKHTLKKMKDQEVKQVLTRGGYQWKRGGHGVKEREHGGCILCLCIKIEQ